jgi:c-di-AMP phosphodiesterase-like protein
MKTTEKTFDAVKFMRQQRDKLSEKLSKMTKEEILEYFKKRKTQKGIKPCAQQP